MKPMLVVPTPTITLKQALAIGEKYEVDPPFILGVRGYKASNQRGLYDDAICVVDTLAFQAFAANTDPKEFKKGIASLVCPQLAVYKIGTHNITKEKIKQYQALVQAGPVKITRDESDQVLSGYFGINIHRGGNTTVGSEGCQTIPPIHWGAFMKTIWRVLRMRNLRAIDYLLVNGDEL